MSRHRLTELRRTRIGMVFQQPNLLPSLTAAEQLQVMAHLDGRSLRAERRHAMELLEAVGLTEQADRRPHQRTGSGTRAAILDLITTLTHREGTATVLVTHDRSYVAAVDQIVEIEDGRLRSSLAARHH